MTFKKSKSIILQLCADTGSDTKPYQDDPNYEVILVGKNIGVENYNPPNDVRGIIANPVCLEFSRARIGGKPRNTTNGMELVEHCIRIINEAKPAWWVIENPAMGALRNYLGKPVATYQPYNYGSPWTKMTALWGNFNMPPFVYKKWEDLEGQYNSSLWIKRDRNKPSLIHQHKSAINHIEEFLPFIDKIKTDSEFRSLCSQKFANKFKEYNP
jgi:hypothetical protein